LLPERWEDGPAVRSSLTIDHDTEKRYRLGRLGFSIDGTGDVVDAINDEFASLPACESESVRLKFRFSDGPLRTLVDSTKVADFRFSDLGFEAGSKTLRFQALAKDDGAFDIDLSPRQKSVVSKAINRLRHWNYLYPHERLANSFMYNVFDFMSQMGHLSTGSSYIHASSFERDGRRVALAAWGGIGKTTVMLKMILEGDWRFLSDDLGLIDDAGTLYMTPKRMQIYGYNLAGEPKIQNALLGNRSPFDKAAWKYKLAMDGPKGVRRRVSAEDLFGNAKVGQGGPLTDLFYIERTDVQSIISEPADAERVTAKCATILLKELQPYTDIAIAMHSTWRSPTLPDVNEMFERSRQVLARAFKGVPATYVQVPIEAGPDDLADFFRTRLK
jgi:hypothetical protein